MSWKEYLVDHFYNCAQERKIRQIVLFQIYSYKRHVIIYDLFEITNPKINAVLALKMIVN